MPAQRTLHSGDIQWPVLVPQRYQISAWGGSGRQPRLRHELADAQPELRGRLGQRDRLREIEGTGGWPCRVEPGCAVLSRAVLEE